MAADLSIMAELRDISPLPSTVTQTLAEALAALTVGIVLAMMIVGVMRLVGSHRRSRKEDALARLAATRALPDDERVFAQAVLLREAGTPTTALRDALYRRDGVVDADAVEVQVAQALGAR